MGKVDPLAEDEGDLPEDDKEQLKRLRIRRDAAAERWRMALSVEEDKKAIFDILDRTKQINTIRIRHELKSRMPLIEDHSIIGEI